MASICIVTAPVLERVAKNPINEGTRASIACESAKVNVFPAPPRTAEPPWSFMSALRAAIMARALLLTVDGNCPSSQLIDASAESLLPAVVDHE